MGRRRWSGQVAGRVSGRAAAVAAVVLAVTLAAGCTGGTGGTAPRSPRATYDPATSSRMFLPDGASASTAPLVVLVPGGGWVSADPSGLTGLATWLAEHGAATVTITYRTSSDDAYFPVPAQDIACGLADAAARARRAGLGVGEVVLVGHSAGAQLAAVVALDPGTYSGGCSDPAVVPDKFVGLAGPYDVSVISGAVDSLFGTGTPTVAARRAADPRAAAGNRPELAVLLVHGTADGLVAVEQTQRFAAALRAGGHDVTARYVDEAGHASVYSAGVAGPIIAAWLGLGREPLPTGQ